MGPGKGQKKEAEEYDNIAEVLGEPLFCRLLFHQEKHLFTEYF